MARSALVPSSSWVALVALLAAMQVNAGSRPPSFVVQVEDGLLDQVGWAQVATGHVCLGPLHPEQQTGLAGPQ